MFPNPPHPNLIKSNPTRRRSPQHAHFYISNRTFLSPRRNRYVDQTMTVPVWTVDSPKTWVLALSAVVTLRYFQVWKAEGFKRVPPVLTRIAASRSAAVSP